MPGEDMSHDSCDLKVLIRVRRHIVTVKVNLIKYVLAFLLFLLDRSRVSSRVAQGKKENMKRESMC
jgi:hypothetical protein